MQGLQPRVILAVALALTATAGEAQFQIPEPDRIFPGQDVVTAERDYYRTSLATAGGVIGKPQAIEVPGASFVKLHFSEFNIPQGVVVIVRNPEATEIYRYGHEKRDDFTLDRDAGDDGINSFSAMSITGDTAIVQVTGRLASFDPALHRLAIDSYLKGAHEPDLSTFQSSIEKSLGSGSSKIETQCGEMERYDAVCWESEFPDLYDRSQAVAKLVTSGGNECTAWRVGSDNRMFTAEHCISSQEVLDGAEIWFNYESSTCDGSETLDIVKVSGGELLSRSSTLDYALFTVNNFDSISGFGNLGLEVRDAVVGENIFIPQHGRGWPRQISIESDMNLSGYCEVDDDSRDGYGTESDIGYFCDTTANSSGSPVITNSTGRVIALHHMGGCLNTGVKMTRIWARVSDHFGGNVPKGSGGTSWSPKVNSLPVADFDTSCDKLSCSFDAGGSVDSDGTIDSYSWNFGDGSESGGVLANHEYQAGGEYSITLTVVDDNGGRDSYTTQMSVSGPNQPPEAKFSYACTNNACSFNGSGSSDPDGEIVSWNWDFGDGGTASGSQVDHEFSEEGNFTVTLSVTDGEEAVGQASKSLDVSLPNEAPQASFSFECNEGLCQFDASGSVDSDGEITGHKWSFGDGGAGAGQNAEHRYSRDGNYRVTLTVTDDKGKTGSAAQTASVDLPNVDPKASFTVSCDDNACSFNGSGSSDTDGDVVQWLWDFGDGTTGQGKRASHDYAEAGRYTVTLTVSDDEQASAQASRSMDISMPNIPPEAAFTFECDEGSCRFDASGSADSDGRISSYRWSFGDGRTGSGAYTQHSYGRDGNYRVTLTVTDDRGKPGHQEQSIEVDLPNVAPTARFRVSCVELRCTFDATSSSDSDGRLISYEWNLGDSTVRSGTRFTHEYAEDGQFRVELTVTDNETASDSSSQTIEAESKRVIKLSVNSQVENKDQVAYLKWNGAKSDTMDVLRDGQLITTTANSGKYVDQDWKHFRKNLRYQVCESGTSFCSEEVTVQALTH